MFSCYSLQTGRFMNADFPLLCQNKISRPYHIHVWFHCTTQGTCESLNISRQVMAQPMFNFHVLTTLSQRNWAGQESLTVISSNTTILEDTQVHLPQWNSNFISYKILNISILSVYSCPSIHLYSHCSKVLVSTVLVQLCIIFIYLIFIWLMCPLLLGSSVPTLQGPHMELLPQLGACPPLGIE